MIVDAAHEDLARDAPEEVEVVIELAVEPTGLVDVDAIPDGRPKWQSRRQRFDHVAAAVRSLVVEHGGSITGEGYLSSSLRATLPASCVNEIADSKSVIDVSLPARLNREGSASRPADRE